jgi:hypothetical protein
MGSKIWLSAVFATMCACGGATFAGSVPDDGGSGAESGSGSGSSSGSGSGGGTTECPPNVPSNAASCPRVGLACEYGDNANPSCNQIADCASSGWNVPPLGPCASGTCPAAYADVVQNKACSPEGLDCSYAEGQCDCTSTLPVASPAPVWECTTPASGCPAPRPRIGSPCTQPGLSCNYGACTGGVAVECENGIWTQELLPCPV